MQFCTKCGAQVEEGLNFCTKCGQSVESSFEPTPAEQPAPQQPPQYQQPQPQQPPIQQQPPQPQPWQAQGQASGQPFISFNAESEDTATVTIAGRTLKVMLIAKVLTIFMCVLFFLPGGSFTFTLGGDSHTATISAANLAFGTGEIMEQEEGIPMVLYYIIIPAVMFAVFQFYKSFSFLRNRLFIVTIVLTLIGLYGCMSMHEFLGAGVGTGMVMGMTITFSISFWFWLMVISYLLLGAMSVMCIRALKARRGQSHPPQAH